MKFPEQFRFNPQHLPATKAGGTYGAFMVPASQACGRILKVIASDGCNTGWQHVSVSLHDHPNKCPSWPEMALVKRLFWDASECVVQFHPPDDEHVNIHEGCLHLWKQESQEFQMPPKICV